MTRPPVAATKPSNQPLPEPLRAVILNRVRPGGRSEGSAVAATLGRAVNAVGAAAVMFYAQFGYMFSHDDEKRSILRNIFTLNIDHAMYPTACYIPNAEAGQNAWNWDLLDYPFPP